MKVWLIISEPISTDSFGKLKVLGHDGDSLGMNSTQVGVLKERNQISFSSFLKGKNCLALEPDFLLELSCDFSHQSLEGKLSDKQVGLNK